MFVHAERKGDFLLYHEVCKMIPHVFCCIPLELCSGQNYILKIIRETTLYLYSFKTILKRRTCCSSSGWFMEQQYTDMVIGSSYIKNEKDKLD